MNSINFVLSLMVQFRGQIQPKLLRFKILTNDLFYNIWSMGGDVLSIFERIGFYDIR